MKIIEKLRTLWLKKKAQLRLSQLKLSMRTTHDPLREFIYLDEVSLRSLLSSQQVGLKDTISETMSNAATAELAAELSADAVVGKGKFNSRYQTTNSQNIQTTRKVIAQSLFREFWNLKQGKIHLSSSRPTDNLQFDSIFELLSHQDRNIVLPNSELKRGDLIEIEVKLAVDPIFKMSTLISEFLEMGKSTPELIEMAGVGQHLRDAGPPHRLLQHLLAGLIPLRATALNYCVVATQGKEYLVRKNSLSNIILVNCPDTTIYPLEFVGVTEHLSYWKDIRRVLFSAGEFTMLCRISRSGIQKSWTPVKLVDLLDAVGPDFREQINSLGEVSLTAATLTPSPTQDHQMMWKALGSFYDNYSIQVSYEPDDSQKQEDYAFINALAPKINVKSVPEQNQAFKELTQYLNGRADKSLSPDSVLQIRKAAREHSGLALELFGDSTVPQEQSVTPITPTNKNISTDSGCRMVDTEVIAIYW